MAADATLVNMAYKEAMSNVRQFSPEVAKIRAELPGMITDTLVEAIQAKNEENKAENKRQNDLKEVELNKFVETSDYINKYLSTYDRGGQEAAMHDQIFNNTYDYLEELKKEYELYNTVGDDDTYENKKQRMSILGRLDSAKNAVVQLRSYVLEISKLGGDANGGSALSKTNIGRSDLHFIQEVINMDGDYSNVKQSWDKQKNEIVFEVTIPKDKFDTLDAKDKEKGQVRKMTTSEMKKVFDEALIPEKLETAILEQRNSYVEAARKGQTNFGTIQDSADATKNAIGNNKSGASHIFMNRLDGNPSEGYGAPGGSSGKWQLGSWANALESHPALNGKYKVFGTEFEHDLSAGTKKEVIDDLIASEQIQKSDVDTDTSGDISTDEYEAFMDGANRDLAIDALVNYKNKAYDHDLSVREFSLWNAKLNKAKFDKNQKPKDPTGGAEGTNSIYGYRTWADMQNEYNLIANGKEGDIIPMKYNNVDITLRRMKDGRFEYDGADGKIIFTPNQVLQGRQINHLAPFAEPEGGYKTILTEEQIAEQKATEEKTKAEFSASIPLPRREITSGDFGQVSSKARINELKELYSKYGDFTFTRSGTNQLRILAPDGKTETFVRMDRMGLGNKESRNKIRDFIIQHAVRESNEFAEEK
tara:strand:+ start:2435 stop:4375 length:1941 start_codon:yes stop_codon:yes gene_type:complete